MSIAAITIFKFAREYSSVIGIFQSHFIALSVIWHIWDRYLFVQICQWYGNIIVALPNLIELS